MMPIIHFVNCKTQSAGGMSGTLGYITRDSKTDFGSEKLVTALNCSRETALEEMRATKDIYRKTDGRQYYHMVQSFPKGYAISPALAHKVAVEFAEKALGKYECVVATHTDREHIHSHFLFNSVSFEDGRKYHSDKESLAALMKISDEICLEYGVHVLEKPKPRQQQKPLSDREYRSAERGESHKFALMNTITEAMKQAKTKKQFVFIMRQYGYGVRWEDSRKYITYTCPDGMRCRDIKLHDVKFTKELMENEFKARYEILNGTQQQGLGGCAGNLSDGRRSGKELERDYKSAGENVRNGGGTSGNGESASDEERHGRFSESVDEYSENAYGGVGEKAGGFGSEDEQHGGGNAETGWVHEREILLAAQGACRMQTQAKLEASANSSNSAIGVADIVGGLAAFDSIIDESESDCDEDEIFPEVDSKAFREIAEKKMGMGIKM